MQGSIQLTSLGMHLMQKSSLGYDICPHYHAIFDIDQWL